MPYDNLNSWLAWFAIIGTPPSCNCVVSMAYCPGLGSHARFDARSEDPGALIESIWRYLVQNRHLQQQDTLHYVRRLSIAHVG